MLKRGLERAKEMMQKYEEEGVFEWAPSLRRWLNDKDDKNDKNYIVWLGTLVFRYRIDNFIISEKYSRQWKG